VAQFASVRDKQANRQRAREYLSRAADAGAALAVLPEAAMHPFGRPDEALTEVAEPLDGPYGTELATAAAATGVTVLAGMFEAVPGESRIYNTVLAVGPAGPIGHYRKLHLFDALGWRESDRIRPGALGPDQPEPAGLLTLDVGGLTVGVLTCYDLRFPEQARALVDAGAQLLALPAAWVAGPLKEYHWETLTRARAIENTAYVAAAAQPPPEFSGRSTVLDPMGVSLASVGEVDGLAVAEVCTERLAEVRRKLPVLEHRRYTVQPRAGSLAVP
jgi:predicted amidohydrolase